MNITTLLGVGIIAAVVSLCAARDAAEVLDKQKQLDAQTFWDNRDWDWYRANIPFFECPDAEITTIDLEYWIGNGWRQIPGQARGPERPSGHRANVIYFPEVETKRLRATLRYAAGTKSGLTEFETWGDATLPIAPAPPPTDNLAYNPGNLDFPKASASFTSRFDRAEESNDGRIVFAPEPRNRWTSYESPHDRDWLEIDFGQQESFSRIELAIFDDRGGVQAPRDYNVQYAVCGQWKDAAKQTKSPERPTGGAINTVTFEPVTAAKVRVVFVHNSPARSGVSEILVWRE